MYFLTQGLTEGANSFLNPVASEIHHPKKYSTYKLSKEVIEQNKQQIARVVDIYCSLSQKKDFTSIYNDILSYTVKEECSVDIFVKLATESPDAPNEILDYKIFNSELIAVITAKCRVWLKIENKQGNKEVRILDMYLSKENVAEKRQAEDGLWRMYIVKPDAELTEFFNTHSEISKQIRDCILENKIIVGMTKDDVVASWGKPEDIHRTVGSWGLNEQWVYSNRYLYFENGILTSWQD